MLRIVLDTNVVVTALRSPTGASAALVEMALDRKVQILVSTPLVLEYEAVCKEAEQRIVSGLSKAEVDIVIDALCAVAAPVEIDFLWRPQLRDAADEMVLEAAVNGQSEIIVTYNLKDFRDAPQKFGIDLVRPATALERIGT